MYFFFFTYILVVSIICWDNAWKTFPEWARYILGFAGHSQLHRKFVH